MIVFASKTVLLHYGGGVFGKQQQRYKEYPAEVWWSPDCPRVGRRWRLEESFYKFVEQNYSELPYVVKIAARYEKEHRVEDAGDPETPQWAPRTLRQ